MPAFALFLVRHWQAALGLAAMAILAWQASAICGSSAARHSAGETKARESGG